MTIVLKVFATVVLLMELIVSSYFAYVFSFNPILIGFPKVWYYQFPLSGLCGVTCGLVIYGLWRTWFYKPESA